MCCTTSHFRCCRLSCLFLSMGISCDFYADDHRSNFTHQYGRSIRAYIVAVNHLGSFKSNNRFATMQVSFSAYTIDTRMVTRDSRMLVRNKLFQLQRTITKWFMPTIPIYCSIQHYTIYIAEPQHVPRPYYSRICSGGDT